MDSERLECAEVYPQKSGCSYPKAAMGILFASDGFTYISKTTLSNFTALAAAWRRLRTVHRTALFTAPLGYALNGPNR